ncbi:uncharacterized protein CXorf65 homolog [Babylonia areolata]|uniref:uncharacterized protein CXorf65 homolog n=1 Tax=Babylonia areolata TaxID=304850 RepID=UPI003FD694B6
MFVTVRYGENQTKIFNADCKNEILLENIKMQCDCPHNEAVEVSDEHGVVKNLRNFPTEYGSDFLKGRETLVLLTVQNGADKPVFTPLLASLRNDPDFNDTLNREMELDLEADHNVSSPRGINNNNKRQQHPPGDLVADNEDVLNRSLRGKSGRTGSSSSVQHAKKPLHRRNTKTSTHRK